MFFIDFRERNIGQLVASHTPQPGIKPATFWCMGPRFNQLNHLAKALYDLWFCLFLIPQRLLYLPNTTYHILPYIFMDKSFSPEWAMGTLPYLFSLSRCSIVTELKLTSIYMLLGSFILRTVSASSTDLIFGELCTWLCKSPEWPYTGLFSLFPCWIFTFLLVPLPQTSHQISHLFSWPQLLSE